jgi:phage head maturation protease
MVARGELSGISAGYRVDTWGPVIDSDGDIVDPARANWDDDLTFTAVRWQLLEASLVGIPADGSASIRSRSFGGSRDTISDIRTRMHVRQRMAQRHRMHDAAQAVMLGICNA